MHQGSLKVSGNVRLSVIRSVGLHEGFAGLPVTLRDYVMSAKGVMQIWRKRNAPNIDRGLKPLGYARRFKIPTFFGCLSAKVLRADGDIIDYGLISLRVITTVGAGYLVDCMQNLQEPENMKFHGIGTASTAESATDTALGAELTTQLNPDSTRATGTLSEGADGTIFETVGTNTVDAAVTITEHGIFSSATVGAGVLLDRSVFAGIGLSSGDSLQTTYDLTFATGG